MNTKYVLFILLVIIFLISLTSIFSGAGDNLTDFISNDKKTKLPYATSEYPKDKWGNYSALNAFDGDIKTAWVEGLEGYGRGATIVFIIPPGSGSIEILPGYGKKNVFSANNRVKEARLSFYYAVCSQDTVTVPVTSEWIDFINLDFKDEMTLQEFKLPPLAYPDYPYNSLVASLTILDVFKGRDDDTCIAEIKFKEYIHNLDNYLKGAWHGSPVIGGGYSERYYFYPDGSFDYFNRQIAVNETVNVPFLASYSGYWSIKGSTLTLEIHQEETIVDPVKFSTTKKIYKPPKVEEYILSPVSRFEGFEYLPYMTIGNRQFWYFNYMKED